jgi:hypothetical protein
MNQNILMPVKRSPRQTTLLPLASAPQNTKLVSHHSNQISGLTRT